MSRTSKDGFPVRLIGLHNITVDTELQSRVATDIETQKEYSEAMLCGDKFPPLVVFDDGKKLWLSAGFHRHGAALKALLKEFECEVRPGTRRDAIVFSTASNKEFGKRPTKDDIRKSCEMLFADPEWGSRSNSMIGRHAGIDASAVKKYRVSFCEKTNTPYPEKVETKNGNIKAARHNKTIPIYAKPSKCPGKATQYVYGSNVKGQAKAIHLGSDLAEATKTAGKIHQEKNDRKRLFCSGGISSYLTNRHIAILNCGTHSASHPGMFGYAARNHFVSWTPLEKPEDATYAVARAILGSIHAKTTGRKVVLCDPENAPAAIVELARQAGVEFVTPEDFVVSLQNEPSQLRAAQ